MTLGVLWIAGIIPYGWLAHFARFRFWPLDTPHETGAGAWSGGPGGWGREFHPPSSSLRKN